VPSGLAVVKEDLEGPASLGEDPPVRDARRTRRARQIHLALGDREPLRPRWNASRRRGKASRHPKGTGHQAPQYWEASMIARAIHEADEYSAGRAQARLITASAVVTNVVVRAAGVVPSRLDLTPAGTVEQHLGLTLGSALSTCVPV
jgi:hypothetical protein